MTPLHPEKFQGSRNAEKEHVLPWVLRCGPRPLFLTCSVTTRSLYSSHEPRLFLFLLLFVLYLFCFRRKGRSLHTCTPPCVPGTPVLIKWYGHFCVALSLLCHCCVLGGSLSTHWRPGSWAGSCRNLKPCSICRVPGPPLFSHCPYCLVAQNCLAVSLVSLEEEQWAGFLLSLPEA